MARPTPTIDGIPLDVWEEMQENADLLTDPDPEPDPAAPAEPEPVPSDGYVDDVDADGKVY